MISIWYYCIYIHKSTLALQYLFRSTSHSFQPWNIISIRLRMVPLLSIDLTSCTYFHTLQVASLPWLHRPGHPLCVSLTCCHQLSLRLRRCRFRLRSGSWTAQLPRWRAAASWAKWAKMALLNYVSGNLQNSLSTCLIYQSEILAT